MAPYQRQESKQQQGRKWSQKYGCECGSDKKKLVAVKGPQVAVVFARSGSVGLQGSGYSGNTDKKKAHEN